MSAAVPEAVSRPGAVAAAVAVAESGDWHHISFMKHISDTAAEEVLTPLPHH